LLSPWLCSGSVPNPARTIAGNLSNQYEEIFVVTRDGKLFVKQEFVVGWGSYTRFTLPRSDSFIWDLSTNLGADSRSHVFAIDDDRVVHPYRESGLPYATYSRWFDIGPSAGGKVLSSCILPDGRQTVVSLDATGIPFQKLQLNATPDSGF